MIDFSSLTDLVYEELKKRVVGKKFLQGEHIVEEKVAETLGISRTTARRAIDRLVNDGLFVEKGRKGIYVNEITYDQMLEIYEIRAHLEGLATAQTALRATKRDVEKLRSLFDKVKINDDQENFEYMNADMNFHTEIVQLSGYDLIPAILTKYHLIISCFSQTIIRIPMLTYPEHMDILSAIEKKDSVLSRRLMEEHVLKSRSGLLAEKDKFVLSASN